jgi:integrase
MIFRRGKYYSYRFMFNGQLIQKSTRQTNAKTAALMESAERTAMARGEARLGEKKKCLALSEFLDKRVEPWSEKQKLTTATWYSCGIRPILRYAPLADLPLDEITSEHVAAYVAHRKAQGRKIPTVNRELRVLRRSLRLALEWGELSQGNVPRIRMAGAEVRRERVVDPEEFAKYLASSSPLLNDVATILHETGLRPDECHRLAWPDVTFTSAPGMIHGCLYVREGKTPAARRRIPMTENVREVIEARWRIAGQPDTGWVFPAPTWAGHIDHSSLKKQHHKAIKASGVRPFLLYSLRHTFATRIADRVDPWTLMKIMGWSTLAIAMSYVHTKDSKVLAAFTPELAS